MATEVEIDKKKLIQIVRQTPQKAHDIVFALLHEGEAYIKDHMGEDGSPAPGGSFPGIRTGELKNSITVNRLGMAKGEITSDKEYAIYLELGTETKDGEPAMFPRPFMLPMAYWLEGQVDEMFKELIE